MPWNIYACHEIQEDLSTHPTALCLQDDAGTLFDSSIPTAGVSDHSEMVGNASTGSGGPTETTIGNTTTIMSFKFLVQNMVQMFPKVCEIPHGYAPTKPHPSPN